MDIRILLNDNTEIDIEIQLSELSVWADRSLFYLAKMYIEQISAGQNYTVFKKCVSIIILDFKLFRDEDKFYSCFHIREDSNDILLWAKFINAEQKEGFDMIAQKIPILKAPIKSYKILA